MTKKKSKRKKEKEIHSAQRDYEEPEGLSVNLSQQDDSFAFPSYDDFDAEQKDISNLLREWIWVKERFSVAILGEKGSGKSFLVFMHAKVVLLISKDKCSPRSNLSRQSHD